MVDADATGAPAMTSVERAHQPLPRTVTITVSVAAMLRDYRMLAHDDGEGRPLRYMSLYGGIVAKML